MKLRIGALGFYKKYKSEIKTTRCFRTDKNTNTQVRGVELWVEGIVWGDVESLQQFIDCGRQAKIINGEVEDYSYLYVFVSIEQFRKYFVYSEAATLFYAK